MKRKRGTTVEYIKLNEGKIKIVTRRPGERPFVTIAQVVPPEGHRGPSPHSPARQK